MTRAQEGNQAQNAFEDLSGLSAPISKSANPFNALIDACGNDPSQITTAYTTHRTARAQQQRTGLLSAGCALSLDPILQRLISPSDPTYLDPRNCLVVWARPPAAIRALIHRIQQRLRSVLPNLWLMPDENLHMTVLEIAHSRTESEISELVAKLDAELLQKVKRWPEHPARRPVLYRPCVTYDRAGLALSFAPKSAAVEAERAGDEAVDYSYTYHHLRGDVWGLMDPAIPVGSRYVVPSAHLTIGRFVTGIDTAVDGSEGEEQVVVDTKKMRAVIEEIERVNKGLEEAAWGTGTGEWIVGGDEGVHGDKGLVVRRGRLGTAEGIRCESCHRIGYRYRRRGEQS